MFDHDPIPYVAIACLIMGMYFRGSSYVFLIQGMFHPSLHNHGYGLSHLIADHPSDQKTFGRIHAIRLHFRKSSVVHVPRRSFKTVFNRATLRRTNLIWLDLDV